MLKRAETDMSDVTPPDVRVRLPRRQETPNPSPVKRCKTCHVPKPLADFPVRAKGALGVAAHCLACVEERYQSGTFGCSRCGEQRPGVGFFRAGNGSAVMQPCKDCRSAAAEQKTRLRRISQGRSPYHLLSEIDTGTRRAVCRECGPTHIYATGAKIGCGWRCGKRSDDVSAKWYEDKAEIVDKHASRHWHRLRDVRGEEMRGTCSQCGDVPVRWNPSGSLFTCAGRKKRERHAVSERRRKRLKVYGLTDEDYERMNAEQSGRCAICRRDDIARSDSTAGLVVDHCHATGRVRGLLCNLCNAGIGHLREDPAIFLAAIEYLRRPAA